MSHPGTPDQFIEAHSTWAPAAFDVLGFEPTAALVDAVSGFRNLAGIVATQTPIFGIDIGLLAQVYDATDETQIDSWVADGTVLNNDARRDIVGGWFFRQVAVTAVPEPATLAMLSLALLLGRYGSRRTRYRGPAQ